MRLDFEPIRFLGVGLIQIVLDSSLFVALTWLGFHTPAANLCGRIGGASVGFWLNGKFTFSRRTQPAMPARFIRYAVVWLTMTTLSTVLLSLIARDSGLVHAWWSKPAIESGLGVASYVLSRFWIYEQRSAVDTH